MRVRVQWFCFLCREEGDITLEKSNFRTYANEAQSAHLKAANCPAWPQFFAYPLREKCDNDKEAIA